MKKYTAPVRKEFTIKRTEVETGCTFTFTFLDYTQAAADMRADRLFKAKMEETTFQERCEMAIAQRAERQAAIDKKLIAQNKAFDRLHKKIFGHSFGMEEFQSVVNNRYFTKKSDLY